MAKTIENERNVLLQSKGLFPGHDSFLLTLNANDGITMGALAEKLDISASSTTKIAIKLEEAGFIRREPSRVDSRQNHAFMSESGKNLASEIITGYEILNSKLLIKVKTKDVEKAFKIFDRIESDSASAGKIPKKAGKKKDKKKKVKKS
ncbi:MAG: MarR family transcriptional regulator [Salaquimonas sp.]